MENLVEYPKPEVAKVKGTDMRGGGAGGQCPPVADPRPQSPQTVTSPAWNQGPEVTPEAGTPGGSWLPPLKLVTPASVLLGHVTDPSPSDGQVFPRIQGRKNTQCPVCQQGLHTPEPPDPRERLTAQHLL